MFDVDRAVISRDVVRTGDAAMRCQIWICHWPSFEQVNCRSAAVRVRAVIAMPRAAGALDGSASLCVRGPMREGRACGRSGSDEASLGAARSSTDWRSALAQRGASGGAVPPGEPAAPREKKSDPYGIRTRVTCVKGGCPRPLDEGVVCESNYLESFSRG
jgi:hypothetical protein